nr:hypothetical protein Iba_chr02aCG10570 [Ipomoea batatas]
MRSLSSTEGVGPGESAGALAFEEHDVLVERVVIVVSSDIAMRDKDETDEGRKRRRKRQARKTAMTDERRRPWSSSRSGTRATAMAAAFVQVPSVWNEGGGYGRSPRSRSRRWPFRLPSLPMAVFHRRLWLSNSIDLGIMKRAFPWSKGDDDSSSNGDGDSSFVDSDAEENAAEKSS